MALIEVINSHGPSPIVPWTLATAMSLLKGLTRSVNPYSLARLLVFKIFPVLSSFLASAAKCAIAIPENSTDSPSLNGEAKNYKDP